MNLAVSMYKNVLKAKIKTIFGFKNGRKYKTYTVTPEAYCQENGICIIGMKAAMAVATQHKELQPMHKGRIQKVQRTVPVDMKPSVKAYLWALQNQNISAVILIFGMNNI